jgi:CheY-like chemotaxis protein
MKVLIVEDNQTNMDLFVRIINGKGGYDVVTAPDGQTALDLARQEAPDVIVLDISMPGISGFEVCNTLKTDEQTGDIPIILLTALSGAEYLKESQQVGADAFLSKPVKAQDLLDQISTLIQ